MYNFLLEGKTYIRIRRAFHWKEHSDEFDTILVKDDGSILVSEGLAEYFTSESEYTIIKKK